MFSLPNFVPLRFEIPLRIHFVTNEVIKVGAKDDSHLSCSFFKVILAMFFTKYGFVLIEIFWQYCYFTTVLSK
jgi:hypothetical protein